MRYPFNPIGVASSAKFFDILLILLHANYPVLPFLTHLISPSLYIYIQVIPSKEWSSCPPFTPGDFLNRQFPLCPRREIPTLFPGSEQWCMRDHANRDRGTTPVECRTEQCTHFAPPEPDPTEKTGRKGQGQLPHSDFEIIHVQPTIPPAYQVIS